MSRILFFHCRCEAVVVFVCVYIRVCVREKFEELDKFMFFMVCVIVFKVVICDFCHFLGDLRHFLALGG